MILIASLKDISVGTDSDNYYYAFSNANVFRDTLYEKGEFIYAGWTIFARQYLNYSLYLFVIYGTYIYSCGYVINKLSANWALSIFILITCGFYTQSFNVMRQFWALGISLIGLYHLEKDNTKIYLLCILLAFFIHKSSIILVSVFFIKNIDFSFLFKAIVVIASFILGMFLSSKLNVLFDFLSMYAGRYDGYLMTEALEGERNIVSNLGLNIMFLFTCYFSNKDYKDSLWMKMYWVSIVVYNLAANFGYLIRINEYFAIAQVIVIPSVISQINRPLYKYSYVILMLVYCFSRYYLRTINVDEILPYVMR